MEVMQKMILRELKEQFMGLPRNGMNHMKETEEEKVIDIQRPLNLRRSVRRPPIPNNSINNAPSGVRRANNEGMEIDNNGVLRCEAEGIRRNIDSDNYSESGEEEGGDGSEIEAEIDGNNGRLLGEVRDDAEDGANGIEVAVHRNNQELNKPMQGSDEE